MLLLPTTFGHIVFLSNMSAAELRKSAIILRTQILGLLDLSDPGLFLTFFEL